MVQGRQGIRKCQFHLIPGLLGVWCSGITSALHAEGPGCNPDWALSSQQHMHQRFRTRPRAHENHVAKGSWGKTAVWRITRVAKRRCGERAVWRKGPCGEKPVWQKAPSRRRAVLLGSLAPRACRAGGHAPRRGRTGDLQVVRLLPQPSDHGCTSALFKQSPLARAPRCPSKKVSSFFLRLYHDSVSERFRRWTRNPLGSARRGSNPLGVGTS